MYFSENIRDFTDGLIAAENKARQETESDIIKQLDEDYYVNNLIDIFMGNYSSILAKCYVT